mmetsp:Transcript_21241/g.50368  ORF Transcript_21241/g.50368 Transcript_21241/m.50368 type:complete len:301 (+) Transcript_21241:1534-2436(+)
MSVEHLTTGPSFIAEHTTHKISLEPPLEPLQHFLGVAHNVGRLVGREVLDALLETETLGELLACLCRRPRQVDNRSKRRRKCLRTNVVLVQDANHTFECVGLHGTSLVRIAACEQVTEAKHCCALQLWGPFGGEGEDDRDGSRLPNKELVACVLAAALAEGTGGLALGEGVSRGEHFDERVDAVALGQQVLVLVRSDQQRPQRPGSMRGHKRVLRVQHGHEDWHDTCLVNLGSALGVKGKVAEAASGAGAQVASGRPSRHVEDGHQCRYDVTQAAGYGLVRFGGEVAEGDDGLGARVGVG